MITNKKYSNTLGFIRKFNFSLISPFGHDSGLSNKNNPLLIIAFVSLCFMQYSCKIPDVVQVPQLVPLPPAYSSNSIDTLNSVDMHWREFFDDKNLITLIDTAITNNPDVLMILQNIEIAKNKVQSRNGALLPSVKLGGGLGVEKVGRYTSTGAGDASTEITPGEIVPELLSDFSAGIRTTWEIDIWGKLKSSKNSAITQYLSSVEGRNFVITNLIAEVANSYYELLALDNKLDILKESIKLQENQLEVVKVQKEAAVVTELAVKQFEAQLLNSQSMLYEVLQSISETENKINFLLGRYPQPIIRDKVRLTGKLPNQIKQGIPSQLLKNRPDIHQAELEVIAAKWDVDAAEKEFYPSFSISASLGTQAFRPEYLLRLPESLLSSLIGDLTGPIINRESIIAEYKTANSLQVQAMYEYKKRILNAYYEVTNELSRIDNLEKQYTFKSKEVDVQTQSIEISNNLFRNARANYLEVLNTQREALSSKLELIEVRKFQFNALTNVYKELGGGWK